MKKIIISLGIVLGLIFYTTPKDAVALDIVPVVKTNEEIVISLVNKYSEEYGVSKEAMLRTLQNENNTYNFKLQSGMKYKEGNRWGFPAGTREKSYGVAQIHLPDHPNISYEQATDPDFSIEFMAKEFASGNQRKWMGYKG